VDPQITRFVADILKKRGHEIYFAAADKEGIVIKIIKSYGYPLVEEIIKSDINKSKVIKNIEIIFNLIKITNKIKPNLLFSPSSHYTGVIAKLFRIPYIAWADTETAIINSSISFPFIDTILTPSCFYNKVPKKKHIAFEGYKELAYLHPNWFKHDYTILKKLSLNSSDKIVLLRFSAFHATHDIGLKSHGQICKIKIFKYIKALEKHAKVFISTTERSLGKDFELYELKIAPEEYTNFLSFCSLYIGEGTTTAAEAGILGIPWINIQKTKRGYLIDQEDYYSLGFRTDNLDFAFETAIDWIQDDSIKKKWQKKKQKLLDDKIDVSSFLIWFIENYPESHKIMKKNPEYQNRFK